MKRSTDRILTSHAGSLHRPPDLRDTMAARRDGDPFDEALSRRVSEAIAEVVRLQAENGVDVVNDGEYGKRSWQSYARGRLAGIEQRAASEGGRSSNSQITNREQPFFPAYFAERAAGTPFGGEAVYCVGPLSYIGQTEVDRDIANLRAAIQGVTVADAVLTGLAPGTIEHWLNNEHYRSDEEFLFAIADAMHVEYKMITDAGFILQLDDPDLPDAWQIHPDLTVDQYRKYAELRVEALNHSIRGIPPEQVRIHICWGSGHHPHTQDLPLRQIVDILLKANVQCYSIEAANPRHEHEWQVFEEVKLPEGKIVMPGVIGHAAREFVEHPELVAQRLVRYANLVGRENVIGGTDCGLIRTAHPEIQWAKFRAMAEGARIATRQLWGRP
jgi:5-methyltetrahydropteroyltriglutamate--homocysteine methyltransferase